jgi:hypothetical protein
MGIRLPEFLVSQTNKEKTMSGRTGYFKVEMVVAVPDYHPSDDQDTAYWTTTAVEWFNNIANMDIAESKAVALKQFVDAILDISETEMKLVESKE